MSQVQYANPYETMPYIYDKIDLMLNQYLQQHSKMFVVRADIRYPVSYPLVMDNVHIQRCMAKTSQYFQRQHLDPKYMWVREQKSSIHPHYHCIILLNGHKTRSPGLVFDTLTRLWGTTIDSNEAGLIHYCEQWIDNGEVQYGQMVHRATGIPENVYGIMGYLAKDDGKGEPNDGLRDFGMSRLPTSSMK